MPRGRGRGEVAPEVRSGQNPRSRIGPVDTVLEDFLEDLEDLEDLFHFFHFSDFFKKSSKFEDLDWCHQSLVAGTLGSQWWH